MKLQERIYHIFRSPIKYTRAAWRWKRLTFTEAPPIFANAKPKSGSHLLLQIMHGLCHVIPCAYVAQDPIRTINANGGRRSDRQVLNALKAVPRGVIGWGYVDATPGNVAFLCQPHRVNYFIYRDPRDMLISHVFFATGMHEHHAMHNYYQSLPDFDARLRVAITGFNQDGLYMVSVLERYKGVFEWLNQPSTLCIRFEDLINQRKLTLNRILDQVEKANFRIPIDRNDAVAKLTEFIQPGKSHTFRTGKTGGWKEHFSPENKDIFKEVAGDLLVRLGYEKDNNW